jgi:hypothetical protein
MCPCLSSGNIVVSLSSSCHSYCITSVHQSHYQIWLKLKSVTTSRRKDCKNQRSFIEKNKSKKHWREFGILLFFLKLLRALKKTRRQSPLTKLHFKTKDCVAELLKISFELGPHVGRFNHAGTEYCYASSLFQWEAHNILCMYTKHGVILSFVKISQHQHSRKLSVSHS